jgi:hypothetical protein
MERLMNKRPIIAGFAAILVMGGSAIAIASGARQRHEPPVPPQALGPTGRVDPELSKSFGVFRRDQTAGDSNAEVIAVVRDGAAAHSGANAALARLTLTRNGDALYAMPAVGGVCFALSSIEGIEIGCTDAARAKEGLAMGVMATERGTRLQGLVPDDVRSVTVERAGAPPVTARAVNNGYIADVEGTPTALRYDGPNGPVVVQLPNVAEMAREK